MGKSRFSKISNFNKTNIGKVSKNKPVIYKIKNRSGTNIYTGIAKRGRVPERLEEHLKGGKDPLPGGTQFQIKPLNSIDQARREEKKIIKQEKPKLNKQA